jgi:hypothetical protein
LAEPYFDPEMLDAERLNNFRNTSSLRPFPVFDVAQAPEEKRAKSFCFFRFVLYKTIFITRNISGYPAKLKLHFRFEHH